MSDSESPKFETYLADIHKLLNANEKKVLKTLLVIICVIIALLFIHQVFILTNFVSKLKYYFEYGKMLRDVCNGAYTEYETGRFQVLDNITDIRINLEFYHIIALIFAIGMCVFFMLLIWGYYITLITDMTPFDVVKGVAKWRENYTPEVNWGSIVMQMFILIPSLYFPLVVIVYLSLKLSGEKDISPFQLPDNDDIKNNYYSHFIIMGVILLIFGIYSAYYKGFVIFFTAFALIVLFVLSAYIVTLVCDIYTRKSTSEFYKTLEKFEQDPNDDEKYDMNKYIQECLGFKNPVDSEKDRKWHKMYSDVITILLLIWCILLGIFLISLFVEWIRKPSSSAAPVDSSDDKPATGFSSYVYYFGFLPFVVLYIMLVLVTINVDYNININKYILFKPYTIYRQLISKINDTFNKMLENDKTNVSNNSVCKNYANAIHLAIYQDIFQHSTSLIPSSGVPDNDNSAHPNNNEKTVNVVNSLLFLPRFTYQSVCDSSEYVEYNKLEEYNIDAYINENNNIFFGNSNHCDSIKNILLVVIMNNFVPDNNRPAHDLFDKAKKIKMFKFAINNIKSVKRFDGKRSLEFSDNYENNNKLNNEFKTPDSVNELSDKHLQQVVDQVADIYDRYLNTMLFETRRTLKTICQCADTDDITETSSFKTNIPSTIMNHNTPYITNVKKNYVNVFVNHTKEMFTSINNVLTSTIEINENNRRLAYFVMKNYNMIYTDNKVYQIEEFPNKTQVPEREDPLGDAYLHIEKTRITLIGDNKIKINDKEYDVKTPTMKQLSGQPDCEQIHLNDVTTEIKEHLRKQLNTFETEYKGLYYKDNSYYNQLVYDYKVEYITALITASKWEEMKGPKETYERKYFKLSEFAKKIDNKNSIEKQKTDVSKETSEKSSKMAGETSQTVYAMLLLYALLVIFAFIAIR